MEELRVSSSLEFGHRQLYHNDSVSDDESSCESGSFSDRGDEVDDNNDGSGWDNKNDENKVGDSDLPLSPFAIYEHFTYVTKNEDHDSQPIWDFLVYISSRRRRQMGDKMNYGVEERLSHGFNSMDVSYNTA